MNVYQTAPDIWQVELETPFAVGPVNIFLVKKKDKVMVVDAGLSTHETWINFKTALSKLSIDLKAIDCVVLTHHHIDHTGLINFLPSAIPIYGHWRIEPWLQQSSAFIQRYNDYFQRLGEKMGVPQKYVDRLPTMDGYIEYGGRRELTATVDETNTIPNFEEWQILYTPGHAQSHISLYRKTDGVFIGGDLLLEHISSNAILEPPYNDGEKAPRTLLQYRDALQKCLTLGMQTILPGHGQMFNYSDAFIQNRLQNQRKRRDIIARMIQDTPRTTFDIGQEMFRRVFENQVDLVLSEVQGYLDWLVAEKSAVCVEVDGRLKYRSL
ncbi:hydrolase [Pullulanibacillus camelliae]|uniref:Hydrolase n=1 Tax=Pullulanibacillus camelliae TaxID=1707096 RepID=A0A8J2VM33_9BACL|nr:MBL fold metallo-hydrolase [Pullulanibacillus camelliae]GGE37886.1 hydrolase [Pullulanibacillus camelliae]